MKKRITHFILFSLMLSILATCRPSIVQSLPKDDIVYWTYQDETEKMGFVNHDGSNPVVLDLDMRIPTPVWYPDGKSIAFIKERATPLAGYLSLWQEGKPIHTCKDFWNVESIGGFLEENGNTYTLIYQYSTPQVLLVDISNCQEVESFINKPDAIGDYFEGISLAPDYKTFLYAEEDNHYSKHPVYTIKQMDMQSGEVISLTEGINPAWSPDGSLIAFVRLDGIYLMEADGTNIHRLVDMDVSHEVDPQRYDMVSPVPRWSPDGKWIVYHKCLSSCQFLQDYSIVRFEVMTGIETKIIDGGGYPSWGSR